MKSPKVIKRKLNDNENETQHLKKAFKILAVRVVVHSNGFFIDSLVPYLVERIILQ